MPTESPSVPIFEVPDEKESRSLPETTTIDLTLSSDESSQESPQIRPGAKTEDIIIGYDEEPVRKGYEELKGGVLCSFLTPRRSEKTGLYSDGKFYAAKLKFHMNPSSIPILDTPDDGVLHVVLGWKASQVLSDLCYRYVTSGSWNAKKCGFLAGNHMMRKKVYKCNGISACPILLKSREDFKHATEDEWISLQASQRDSDKRVDVMEMRKARNLYVTLVNPSRHFCYATRDTAPSVMVPVKHIEKCKGRPILRQVRATKEWFVGCTHYYINPSSSSRHAFHSLRSFSEKARGYLREMLEKGEPIAIPGETCEFVAVKKGRRQKKCATHLVDLVECGTDGSSNGRCDAKMVLYEPIGNTNSAQTGMDSVTFALCISPHNHPPPRQPASTEKKNSMFRELAEQAPYTTAAALKLEAQDSLLSGSSSLMKSVELSRSFMYNTLGSIRKRREKDDYSSLFEMMGDPGSNYVRDVRVVSAGFVFLLAAEQMIKLGTESAVFAGDATYKTVKETDPTYVTPDWYLYNIVAPDDITAPSVKGNVVARALMTSLTTEAYASVWEMFIINMRRVKAAEYGLSLKEVPVDVPYMALEPDRKNNAVVIRAITTDFEAAEVDGIARAISSQRGGSPDLHVDNAMIGCGVHFERAFKRRAASLDAELRHKFKDACKRLRCATSIEDGDREYVIIDSIDSSWSNWLSRSHIRPLVAPCFSKMSQLHRMMAFDNTNIVESQNRRVNLICGTGLSPVTCAQRIMKLDTVSGTIATLHQGAQSLTLRRSRKRNGHTLQPAGTTSARGAQAHRGKKRKTSDGSKQTREKEKEAHETHLNDIMDGNSTIHPSSANRVVRSELSRSILWLHRELGMLCSKAVEEGKETLLVALSDLYGSVLQSDDLNEIKYQILDTIKAEKGNREITSEFSKVLVLISNKQAENTQDSQDMQEQHDVITVDSPKSEIVKVE